MMHSNGGLQSTPSLRVATASCVQRSLEEQLVSVGRRGLARPRYVYFKGRCPIERTCAMDCDVSHRVRLRCSLDCKGDNQRQET